MLEALPVQQLLDPVPVLGVFLLFPLIGLIAYEIGYRVGVRRIERTPDEKEGPSGVLVGSLLALMGFLLAVTMGMASDRFDTRRQLVLAEANTIGTLYLRAGYLPTPVSDASRDLLRAYAPLRVSVDDDAVLVENLARSGEIADALWAIAETQARATPDSQVLALYISALNELIDLRETRLVAASYARVPETVILLMFVGSALTLAMVGFHAGLHRQRSLIGAIILVIVLGAVIALVVDLDRPRQGFLTVSQQPLTDVIRDMGPPGG